MGSDLRTAVHIRWMIRRDMPEILAIERECFDDPLSEDEILADLRQRNCIGMVAERDDKIVGFMIYELYRGRMHLLDFAVAKECQRTGIGTELVNKLKSKLNVNCFDHRRKITLVIREANLGGQLFFRKQGFLAVGIRQEHFANGEDAYAMECKIDGR